jgi:hypothetical protein
LRLGRAHQGQHNLDVSIGLQRLCDPEIPRDVRALKVRTVPHVESQSPAISIFRTDVRTIFGDRQFMHYFSMTVEDMHRGENYNKYNDLLPYLCDFSGISRQ